MDKYDLILEVEVDEPEEIVLRPHERNGIAVEIIPGPTRHGFGISTVVEVGLTLAAGVSANLVAEALREAFGYGIRRVRRNGRTVDGTAQSIEGLVAESLPAPPPD